VRLDVAVAQVVAQDEDEVGLLPVHGSPRVRQCGSCNRIAELISDRPCPRLGVRRCASVTPSHNRRRQ
jgi:hypothetical protein